MIMLIIVVGAIYVLGTQLGVDIPNETVNKTNVTRDNNRTIQRNNISTNETPPVRISNETPQVNISKEEAMRLADEVSAELSPPGREGRAVDATLFRWKEHHWREWVPEDRYRTWAWNVTMRYPEGVLPDGELYGDMWIDAQTGEVIMN